MSNIFKQIKYFFLSQKEKNLQQKLKDTTKRSYTNKTSKNVIGGAADLIINGETLKLIDDVKNNVYTIAKKTDCNPEEILGYIKAAKTPIYKIDNADKFLNLIKEEEGFICEKRGMEALYLSIVTEQGFNFKTEPMFIMREGIIDKFYLLHHFYRWYSYKAGLPGFEYEAQKYLKKYLFENSDKFIKTLSMEKLMSLKEAIARDQEATTFVIDFMKEKEGSKKVLDKMKNDGGANV